MWLVNAQMKVQKNGMKIVPHAVLTPKLKPRLSPCKVLLPVGHFTSHCHNMEITFSECRDNSSWRHF